MTSPDNRTVPDQRGDLASDTPQYVHIVGWWRWVISRTLRRVPRALCGVVLYGDPDLPEPPLDGPLCPSCVARDGQPGDLRPVPGYWL
ncbi:hypothetical protein OHB26_39425 (plasmid) [Nocardia sp. NBC_01503]|uniref:hypothetical protein n=1 Tax=Nocardia sp. NBC_01503 TaxID=2975997 RepID=UPI002E7C246D|nr:hypothetical protein [Nocardia sp. NBC_01503]WTL36697.1 hypothetical protein OHB26_39150 [Nocardia sp. NBC_01503]WTL36750.1 hypothetical protein OHB26_39425 [Nocardia sp. NBC_01503]